MREINKINLNSRVGAAHFSADGNYCFVDCSTHDECTLKALRVNKDGLTFQSETKAGTWIESGAASPWYAKNEGVSNRISFDSTAGFQAFTEDVESEILKLSDHESRKTYSASGKLQFIRRPHNAISMSDMLVEHTSGKARIV